MATNFTMLDLITTVSRYADSDAEVVSTVASLINSGRVHLCGNFKGALIDVEDLRDIAGLARTA